MSSHIAESTVYGSSWGTEELRALFDEEQQVRGWLEILAVLAEVQADYELIPSDAAAQIRDCCETLNVDKDFLQQVRDDYQKTNHSLLGFIRAFQRRATPIAGEWFCYGATVQDVTDTQLMMTLARVRQIFAKRLTDIEQTLTQLAKSHRDTLMCGRTHGQPGLAITFGFKAAGWQDEYRRHNDRLHECAPRLNVAQLAGGVGSLSSLGENALSLQARFCERLGLGVPLISWTASRDRLAEWLSLLAMMTSTGDRIGHEVYNLQRPEIGELAESLGAGAVGSITMPQKRNPEISEHLGCLSRLVRAHAGTMLENLVHDHERDGRSWKVEWYIVPDACRLADKSLQLVSELLGSLTVNKARISDNLEAQAGLIQAEAVMLALAKAVGKQTAHQLIYELANKSRGNDQSFVEVLATDAQIRKHIGEDLPRLLAEEASAGACGELVDRVIGFSTGK